MLKQTIVALLNDQFVNELYSAYLYLDMANYYENQSLDGFAGWFFAQAREECGHAMKIRRYLLDNEEEIVSCAIPSPDKKYLTHLAPLEETLRHERAVTESIGGIYVAAHEEKDFTTMQFLDWFLKEQVEEEKSASGLLRKFELFAGDPRGLYLLDRELAARPFAPSAAE